MKESAARHNQSLSDEALKPESDERGLGTRMRELLASEFRSDDYVFEVPGEIRPPPDFE